MSLFLAGSVVCTDSRLIHSNQTNINIGWSIQTCHLLSVFVSKEGPPSRPVPVPTAVKRLTFRACISSINASKPASSLSLALTTPFLRRRDFSSTSFMDVVVSLVSICFTSALSFFCAVHPTDGHGGEQTMRCATANDTDERKKCAKRDKPRVDFDCAPDEQRASARRPTDARRFFALPGRVD